jgi:phosphatidate cytidylyltransferase
VSDGERPDQATPRILRPWESEDETDQAGPSSEDLPREEDDIGQSDEPTVPVDEDDTADIPLTGHESTDFDDIESGPSSLDEYTNDDYLAATTREYQGLAEEVAKANTEQIEQQAVSASLAGVGSGLVGFDDVTGQKGLSEEDVELEEQQRASDLTVRVVTAVVLVGIFLGTLMAGRALFTGFVTIVMVLSLGEFYSTTRSRGFVPVALFGFLGVIGAAIGTLQTGVVAVGVSLAIVTAVVGLFLAGAGRRHPLENAAVTVMGAAWIGLLAFAIAIARAEEYVGLILLVVLVTAGFDAGSYFSGRAFGKRPMAPKVSPKKTWEGYIGGLITALVLASLLSTFKALFPVSLNQALSLAGLVAVLAPLGDAAESVVKRSLDVKDMGSVLPGHGGMLDRIDALLFVVPGVYLLFEALDLLA